MGVDGALGFDGAAAAQEHPWVGIDPGGLSVVAALWRREWGFTLGRPTCTHSEAIVAYRSPFQPSSEHDLDPVRPARPTSR